VGLESTRCLGFTRTGMLYVYPFFHRGCRHYKKRNAIWEKIVLKCSVILVLTVILVNIVISPKPKVRSRKKNSYISFYHFLNMGFLHLLAPVSLRTLSAWNRSFIVLRHSFATARSEAQGLPIAMRPSGFWLHLRLGSCPHEPELNRNG